MTLLADAVALLQAVNEPPLLGVAIVLAIVLAEVVKQAIGPMFRRGHTVTEKLLERMTALLEKVEDETGDLLVLARANHEWHQKSDASGLPLAYYPRDEIMRVLDDIVLRLQRMEIRECPMGRNVPPTQGG